MDQVFEDPQVRHLRMAAPVQSPQLGELHLVASPLNMPGVPKTIRCATPEAGADTDAVLKSVGYSDEEIAGMRSKGVI
jgi:crotonobetainyl-CoA:carnitine CoA-transferase CaiB-like acyl-CoA transferase